MSWISKAWLIAAVAIISSGGSAMADTYQCKVLGKYTNGWILPGYLIEHQPGAKAISVKTFTEDGQQYGNITGRVVSDTAKQLAGTFIWKNARSQRGPVRIRYRAKLNKTNMRFSVSAMVGQGGQIENDRGSCKRVS